MVGVRAILVHFVMQIGGNLGSTVAGLLGVSKQGRRSAVAVGAAAALAAAFILPSRPSPSCWKRFSKISTGVSSAGSAGRRDRAFTVHALIGPEPALRLPRIDEPTWRAYLLMPLASMEAVSRCQHACGGVNVALIDYRGKVSRE
jgi:chloride channel protein, CIC family